MQENDILKRKQRLMAHGWPWPLIKATIDDFAYAIKLTNGEIIFFSDAEPYGSEDEWACLTVNPYTLSALPHAHVECGIYIRVNQIIWAIDDCVRDSD